MRPFRAGWGICVALAGVGPLPAAAVNPVWEAEAAAVNPARAEVVAQDSFPGKRGVALRAGVASLADGTAGEADLVFRVEPAKAGRYRFTSVAAVDAAGAEVMRKAKTKFESLYLRLQIGDRRATRRVVFVPWSAPELCTQHLGNFELAAGAQDLRVWLPAGVRLDRLEITPYKPPTVPPEAVAYRPTILPPAAHPRLWVNGESLAQVRANLSHPDHAPVWERLRAAAAKPFAFNPPAEGELAFNTPLEQAAYAKAFVHLMTGDAQVGREAVTLLLGYLPRVEFGNLLDITRETGAAIYAGACVYDWCYGLLSAAEREMLRRHLLRLADDMECGWPPFRQNIVNGHGNEAMINRDLLSLAIAVYNEDPVPYQYCAYAVLEQLVPMRKFEYRSPRHNQGISYGAYRFAWEMHGAWLFRRMTGREVFDANLKTVPQYWLHMRLPNGEMLRDGDGFSAGKYWSYAQTALLCYAYNGDPVLKGEFQRQGGLPSNPVLFLLLDDPAVPADPRLDRLPLTFDFGPILGGMVARTGWTMGDDSPDVVAEIKGGGYHFGNHEHADAGALQVYYRGLQVAKLAQYGFYGTPYDLNFAKRSIAQTMVRVTDPQETIIRNLANDGGSRFLQSNPRTPQQAMTDQTFNYGRVLACSFGPDAAAPDFSFFAADLQAAYGPKLTAYVRSFCFLNLHRADHPAVMILVDDLTAKDPAFKKVWQLTTLQPPERRAEGVRLSNTSGGVTGRMDVRFLQPAAADRVVEILSGAEVYRIGEKLFTPPKSAEPEANGHRIVVSPRTAQARDRFVTVLQAGDGEPLPVASEESADLSIVRVADRLVALAKGSPLLARAIEFAVPENTGTWQVLVTGLQAGAWRVEGPGLKATQVTVAAGKHTLHFPATGGRYRLTPQ